MSLLLAIIGHLVGDYLLQNDWMAMNKKRSTFHCAIHCTLWTASVCLIASWCNVVAIAILWLAHFLQDRTQIIVFWMRSIGQNKFIQPPMAPWSVIVVDNVWHIVTLLVVWRIFFNN
jgi:hypothetical protein